MSKFDPHRPRYLAESDILFSTLADVLVHTAFVFAEFQPFKTNFIVSLRISATF